ncbi:MAG TPA: hypothetical protein VL984_17995 [Acidimicrobiales bacterium]|nr:hypothetical protein [Acidimicrobiales bacterium]
MRSCSGAASEDWCMADFLAVLGMVLFTVAFLALIKVLEHV